MEQIERSFEELSNELIFSQNILHSLPAIVYVNEIQIPGDMLSGRNMWINKRGLDFIGLTQEEITAMGYSFFTEYIHPDDMEVIPESIKTAFAGTTETIFAGMYRFKNKQLNTYNWLYGNYIPLSTFDDGSVRQMLVVGIDITYKMTCDNQLTSALQEIHKLKHDLKLCNCSKREKDVLNLIILGKTDKEIAKELFISVGTAKKHRDHLIHKTGVKNTAGLVAQTMNNGL